MKEQTKPNSAGQIIEGDTWNDQFHKETSRGYLDANVDEITMHAWNPVYTFTGYYFY